MSGTGMERFAAQAVQQAIDGGQTVNHAEFAFEEVTDLGSAAGTGAVLGSVASVETLTKLFELLEGQARASPSTWSIGRALESLGVVASDPLLDGTSTRAEGQCDLGWGLAATGEDNGAKTKEAKFVRFGFGSGELFEAVMVNDRHGGTPQVSTSFSMHASKAQGRANIF